MFSIEYKWSNLHVIMYRLRGDLLLLENKLDTHEKKEFHFRLKLDLDSNLHAFCPLQILKFLIILTTFLSHF